MKIAMVTCSAFPFHNSGVAYVVHNTAKALTKMGHEVCVISLSQEATTMSYSGYQVIGIKLPGTSHNFANTFKETDYHNPIGAEMLEYILEDIKPDIVHFHSLNGLGASMVKTAKTLGYKTVITMHDWWWMCPFAYMADKNHKPCQQLRINEEVCNTCIKIGKTQNQEDYIIKRSAYLKGILKDYTDLIIPVSSYLESFLEPNGITHAQVITVPNGPEPCQNQGSRPTSTNTNTDTNSTNSTDNKPIIFGFLGGKHQLKGYDLLLEAVNTLDEAYHDQYEVHVYGALQLGSGILKKVLNYLKGGNLKDLMGKIKRHMPNKQQNQDLPISYHPLFAPEEKDQVYETIDVLLSLSKVKESSSLVVREALIRGIPVITTPSGGPEEVIKNGKNGIVLKASTAKELKEAMEQILMTNSLKHMKDYIQRNPYTYTYKDQVTTLIEAYENI